MTTAARYRVMLSFSGRLYITGTKTTDRKRAFVLVFSRCGSSSPTTTSSPYMQEPHIVTNATPRTHRQRATTQCNGPVVSLQ